MKCLENDRQIELALQKEHEDKIQELENFLNETRNDKRLYKNELSELKITHENIKSELERETDGLQTTIKEKQQDIATLRIIVDKQSLQIESDAQTFNAASESSSAEIAQLKMHIEQLTKQVDVLHNDLKDAVLEKQRLAMDILSINGSLEKQHKEKQLLEHELEILKEAKETLKTQKELFNEEIKTVTHNLEEKEREIEKYKELVAVKVKESEDAASKYNAATEVSSSEIAARREQIRELSSQLDVVKTEINAVTEAKEQFALENEKLKNNLVECEKDKQVYLKENEILKKEGDEKLEAQREKFEGKLKMIADTAKKQYKNNLEKGLAKLNKDIESRDKKIEENKQMQMNMEKQIGELKYLEKKYENSKSKLKELLGVVEEERAERNLALQKYQASKETIKIMHEERAVLDAKLKEANSYGPIVDIQNENDSLKYQIKQLTSENRSLTVQVTHANTQIRGLQSEQHQMIGGGMAKRQTINTFREGPSTRASDRRQTMAAVQSASYANIKENVKHGPDNVFKMPSEKRILPSTQNTPGRAKAGRTQSEAALARKPPIGSGTMFMVDDEAGEMFSSSYLSDMKKGKCDPFGNNSANSSGFDRRLSELSRRNTMVPAHLQSSYPAETQFFHLKEFNDADLQHGRLKNVMPFNTVNNDVSSITNKTANLSVDSPSMNTRNKRKPVTFSIPVGKDEPQDDPGTPALTLEEALNDKVVINAALEEKSTATKELKRRSTSSVLSAHSHAMNESRDSESGLNKSSSSNASSKRAKKNQHSVSYSRPGPPTPARVKANKSICSNTSLDSASQFSQSVNSGQDKSVLSNAPATVVCSNCKNV